MTINLNGVEFYSAQEVDERIREAIAGKDKEVDMSNLPIGAKVEVIGNSTGHEHEYGEVLEITKVENDEVPYLLDDRTFGWVAIEDIEFVSFPEEEESTSGNEENPDLGFKNGDFAKVLESNMIFNEGDVIKILEVEGDGQPLAEREDGVDGYAMASQLMKIGEPSGNGDEDESELEFKVGDKVRVKGADYHSLESGDIGTVTDIAESIRHTHNGRLIPTPYEVTINNNLGQFVAPKHLELIEEVESEDSEIKAGDIVIATEDEFDITKGVEYEIKQRETGTLYFFDDDGDIRHVNVHEEILRKKTAKRGFKKGDVVYVNEEITDNSGDSIYPGVITEFVLDSGVLTPDGTYVVVEVGDIGKLTLVCRAEDRLDKSKEDE